jgi:diphthine synthase
MLWFLGIGIYGISGMSRKASEVLEACDIIYVEKFTSLVSDKDIKTLHSSPSYQNKKVVTVQRSFIEDGTQIIREAADSNIVLLSYGDPMVATTLNELRLRALDNGIKASVIYGISGITSLVNECGLQTYRIGKIVTMMEDVQSGISVYNTIYNNLQINCHTLILGEYRYNEDDTIFFLSPKEIMNNLDRTEKDLKFEIINGDTFLIVASRIGTEFQKIVSGKIKSLLKIDFGDGPHTLIYPSKLHFMEEKGVLKLTTSIDSPSGITVLTDNISTRMMNRYLPMIREEISKLRNLNTAPTEVNETILEILDNAEYYVDDALNFKAQGKNELAILSIGYADGLVDCINWLLRKK